jgi:hypothetical protein
VQSSKSADVLDIDELLNDQEAMGALRAMLKAEMAAAHTPAASGAAAAAAPNSSSRQQQARPRGRAFDSDEYDASALESVFESSEADSMDDMAQDAANTLLQESRHIADHILHEHEGDGMLDTQQRRNSSSSSSSSKPSSSRQAKDASSTLKLKLPAFAAGAGSKADKASQQQQQQQGRGSKASRPANSSSGGRSNGSQGSSRSSRGSSSADGSGSDGGSSDSSSSRGPRRLSADSAIGRVCEAKGGVPVVVLKKGKARLFELGSPMVGLVQGLG